MKILNSRWLRAAACILPSAACFLLTAATDFTAEGKRWWSHIEYLASDDLQGRNTGSEGHLKAARYIAGEFERSGLKPAGTSGYFQPVKFDVKQIVEEQSSLALVRDGKAEPLVRIVNQQRQPTIGDCHGVEKFVFG